MQISIVIPTYWGWETGKSRQPGDSIYDHPTPIDTTGTLGRCLESLKNITGYSFNVLIITSAINPALEQAAEAKVENIIAPFRKIFPIAQFGPSDLTLLRNRLAHLGFDPEMVGLSNYANVRNCQLIGPHLLGSDVIVAIDDDEVITDADYLRKATEYLGQECNGVRVDGVAGIYVDRHGNSRLLERSDARTSTNLFRRKDAIMNDALAHFEALPGRLVETSISLGGNMIFSRPLFETVSFDPWITRGEDIDYLINSRLHGRHWFLHKELFIVHLPPGAPTQGSHSPPSYSKLQQDVIRFIYERAKLTEAANWPDIIPLKVEELDPYPGAFLREGLEAHALEALIELRPADTDPHLFPPPEDIVADAVYYAKESAPRYFAFAREWPRLMAALADDRILQDHFRRKLGC